MSLIKDFSRRQFFPGDPDTPVDKLFKRSENLERIPDLIFALCLFIIAGFPTFGKWHFTAALWLFFMLDWLLLILLPRAGKSFGPPKPVVLLLAAFRIVFVFIPLPLAAFAQVCGTVLVFYGFWIEPHRLTVTYQKLYSDKLTNKEPLRILHLGDLHIERITAREDRLSELITSHQPDLILFSGDVLNLSNLEDRHAWQDARQVISKWKAPLGTFLVTGSTAVDCEHLMPEIKKDLPVRWLHNERITIQSNNNLLDIVGLDCTHRPDDDNKTLSHLLDKTNDHFSILLYHSPDLAPHAAQQGIDLQLSGHTHGGQVRLPVWGALITASLYGKRYEAGRYQVKDMTLYTTRGIGMEGGGTPRVRFLCPPEIIFWDISPTPDRN